MKIKHWAFEKHYSPTIFGHTSTPPPGHSRFTRRDSYYWYVLLMWTSEAGIELSRASLRVSSNTGKPTEQALAPEYKPQLPQPYPAQHHYR